MLPVYCTLNVVCKDVDKKKMIKSLTAYKSKVCFVFFFFLFIYFFYLFFFIIFLLFFSIVVHCKSLHAPPDGQVKPDSCRTYPEYGTTCHFSCSQGYRLHGGPIVTCLSDGLWSGNTTTFCKGWFIFEKEAILFFFLHALRWTGWGRVSILFT